MIRNNKFTWTIQEEEFLKLNYKKITAREIAVRLNKSRKSIFDKAYQMKLAANYTYDKNFFKIPNIINSYWAGFIAADGCLYQDKMNRYSLIIELSNIDKNHLDKFKKDIKYNGKIYDRVNKSPSTNNITVISTLRISVKKEFFDDLLKNFNLFPHKTHRLAPPLNLSEENLLAYLIGYLDGDGCICLANRISPNKLNLDVSFTSSSHTILEWIRNFTNKRFNRSLKTKTNKVCNISGTTANQFHIAGLRACHMVDFLRKINVPKLSRKWENPHILKFIENRKIEFPQLFI